MSSESILEVQNLSTSFSSDGQLLDAVDSISFEIKSGETFCLVGESGSGKSVTSLTIMGLLSEDNVVIRATQLRFDKYALDKISADTYRKLRGRRMAMIFQEPMTALNPVYKVGHQVAEVFQIHEKLSKNEARIKAFELFEKVKIPDPERRFYEYPHQLSGGMKQRVMIAMALACKPDLLIADEPTTALDVTVQAQILHLLKELQKDEGTSILFITHDLGVVAQIADRVAVMYAGKIVETASVFDLFEKPLHPYTKSLLKSIPTIRSKRNEALYTIQGNVPPIHARPSGCCFRTRCAYAKDICSAEIPQERTIGKTHKYVCHFTPEGLDD